VPSLRSQQKIISVLLASVAIDFIGFAIVLPLLPFYAKSFGASSLQVGLVFGIFSFMAVFAPPFWGSVSDRIGRRPALLLNLTGTGCAYLWFSFASSLWMLLGARILAGLTSSSIVIAQAYISDLTTPANRTKIFGYLDAAAGIGFILGPAICSALLGSDPQNPNFRLPGLVAAATAGMTLCLALFLLPITPIQSHNLSTKSLIKPRRLWAEITAVFKRPLIGTMLGIAFLLLFAGMGGQAIFGLWCEKRLGWGPQQFGHLLILYCFITAIIQVTLAGQLAQRFGEVNLFLWGTITTLLGFIFITLSNTGIQLILILIPLAFTQAVVNPSLTSLLSQLSAAKQQGKTLGLLQSTFGLSTFLGALWAGFLFDRLGENWPYWSSTIVVTIGAICIWKKLKQSHIASFIQQCHQQKLIYLFELLDYDKNGLIELEDFQKAAHRLAMIRGIQTGVDEYKILRSSWVEFGQHLQHAVGQGGTKKINRKEWLFYLNRITCSDFSDYFVKIIDSDHTGLITIRELQDFYQAYNIDISNIEEVFAMIDLDQNGYISEDEFGRCFAQFLYSKDIQARGNWIFGVSLPAQL
jgi:DHA1 family tetracycline resistance protein-like MFS transporter